MTPEEKLRPQHDLAGDQTGEDHDVIQTRRPPPRVDGGFPGLGKARLGRPDKVPAGAALDANVARRLPMPPG